MIVNKAIADRVATILRQLFDAKYPIQRMLLPDVYDADDESTKLSKHAEALHLFYNGFRSSDDVHTVLQGIEAPSLKIVDGGGLRGFGMAGCPDSRRHILDGFILCHGFGHVLVKVGEAVETVGVGGQALNSNGQHHRRYVSR